MQQKQEVDEDEEASETSSSLERIDLTQSQMAAE
jgi:hypothetical protein